MKQTYLEMVREGVLNWLEEVRYQEEGWGKWKYNADMKRKYGLIPSANAIHVLECLGELQNISDEKKEQAIRFFQSAQDPKDGYFKDPLVTEEDRVPGAIHSWEDIWGQMGVAAKALQRLGAKPLYPLPTQSFADIRDVAWLRGLNWANPWHVGERFANAVKAYVRTSTNTDYRSDPVIQQYFEILETEIIDETTGMPTKRGCTEPSVALAGLFKIMMGYLEIKRPVLYPERAIDFTLAIQKPDGEFGYGRNMCINWDSLWVLRELDRQLNGTYRHADIVAAGNRMAEFLLEVYRKPDGGFAFLGELCWAEHHSIKISDKLPISDMMGTRMCLECLEYADEWNA